MWHRRIIVQSVLAALAVACGASTADPLATPDRTPEAAAASPQPTGPGAARVSEDDALAVNDASFDAYDAGDIDGIVELFAPDVELVTGIGPLSREEWTRLHVWKLAEGTELLAPECTAGDIESPDGTVVECRYAHHEYLARAVDGPPVPFKMTMVVGAEGITHLTDVFGYPDFGVVAGPFAQWMEDAHPEDVDVVGCCGWASDEEARMGGAQTAAYADEWAAALEAAGCAYDEPRCLQ